MSRAAHSLSPPHLAAALETDLEHGLSSADAAARLVLYGPNRPRQARRRPLLRLATNQLLDPLVALLAAAAAISIAIGETTEGLAIAAILVLNAVLGFWQEAVADRAILALSQAFTQSALVIRDGVEAQIPAEAVVPGDIIRVSAGERVPADARLFDSTSLDVDESALTGESFPVAKETASVAAATPLADRTSMVYAGTAITRGSALCLVSATGPTTELGAIEILTATARAPTTPMTRQLARLARQMVVLGIAITVLLGALILARGGDPDEAFLTAVAVAVAAVPEGLAATVTVALALGARAMASRGAIVRRLAAIETIGETTVICTDKTGTLTENQIRVRALQPSQGVTDRELLEGAVLASNARVVGGQLLGDPVETAVLLAAMEHGVVHDELVSRYKRIRELPFSSERKRMTVVYLAEEGQSVFTKGAPEILAERLDTAAEEMLETAVAWASDGLRVLAVAARELRPGQEAGDHVERHLRLLGVIALHDPLRPSSQPAVAAARRAGIAVRMLTGDHPATARTIGRALGLSDEEISARATPSDKLDLVESLQASGEVVAVTGDGVNDAPALRRADVGVAMGRSGTEAAREAASIVLTDDDFATIVAAVAEGRRIGDNIRKFVAFLLSANLGEVLVFSVVITAGLGSPLAVIQILLVNLVTDGLPALALARDPADRETMTSPPRTSKALFDRGTWVALAWIGVLVGGTTVAAFAVGRVVGGGVAQTMAFATLALAELALVYGMRSPSIPAWRLPANRWLNLSVFASVVVIAAVIFLPAAHAAFATTSLSLGETIAVVLLSFVPLAGVELYKGLVHHGPRRGRGRSAGRATDGRTALGGMH